MGHVGVNVAVLADTAAHLMADDKGILAIDESNGPCDRRFAAVGIEQSEESRRRWRELIITTPEIGQAVSGMTLYDETIHQATGSERCFVDVLTEAGILVGIKVDTGAKPLAGFSGETITEGLDGLRQRLLDHASIDARFAKWRAVFSAEDAQPSLACIDADAQALARGHLSGAPFQPFKPQVLKP